jgi:hypothetical protein
MRNNTRAIAFIASFSMIAVSLPARAADPPLPFTWLGVTIGQPAAQLRPALGDPLLVTGFTDSGPAYREARYAIEGTHAFLVVTEQFGRVRSFRAVLFETPDAPVAMTPDPSGITLGLTTDQVAAKHPNANRRVDGDWVWLYEPVAGQRNLAVLYKFFLTGRLQSIDYFLAPNDKATPPPGAFPALTEPAGNSYDSAILDGAKDEISGVTWETLYLALHPCAPNQRWKMQKQSLQNHANREYDILHVACPSTNVERDYFFDITGYYGKL